MKRYISLFTAIITLFGLCACGLSSPAATPVPVPSTIPAEPVETPAPELSNTPVPEASETPAPVEGEIFLSVSEINFSTVGESENIYAGSLPIENVSWRTEDESVATVESGVVTAMGVGSTTVHAEAEGQSLSCLVSCLAANEEELKALPEATLRSPKRIPYVPENPPLEYFDDAVIIGDSITYFLFQFETKHALLGNPMFLTRGGTSLLGIKNRSYNIYYQGQDLSIEDSVAMTGRKKVFLMLGQNDLGYRTIEDTLESYDIILSRILEKSPDVDIYIQSVVHEWAETRGDNSRNEKIDLFNAELIRYAEEKGYHYVDIQKYIVDHTGRMAQDYSMDNIIHVNEPGCIIWMQALLAYAHTQLIGVN